MRIKTSVRDINVAKPSLIDPTGYIRQVFIMITASIVLVNALKRLLCSPVIRFWADFTGDRLMIIILVSIIHTSKTFWFMAGLK